jgi:chemotaxis protein histidine kinase CheA
MIEDQEILTEFIIETNENLVRLSQDLIAIETRPKDADLLASIFRTFHTIKRTAGFLGFSKLESLTHVAENVLSQVRNGERNLTADLVLLILETTDAVTTELASIESTGGSRLPRPKTCADGRGALSIKLRVIQWTSPHRPHALTLHPAGAVAFQKRLHFFPRQAAEIARDRMLQAARRDRKLERVALAG